MKQLFFLVLLGVLVVAVPVSAVAQQSKRDSLETLLKRTPADTNRVIQLNKAVGLFYSNDPKKAKQYAEQALQLSRRLNYQRGIGRSYLSLGVYQWSQGAYQPAIDLSKTALPYFEKLNDQNGIAAVYSNLGVSARGLGDFAQAITYYFKSLSVNEKIGDQAAVALNYNNIGIVFKYQEKYDQALYYYWQSFRKSAGIEPRNQAGTLQNIGLIYQLKKDYPKAITYLNQARTRFAALHEPKGLVICDNNLGETYSRMQQYDRAEQFIQRALTVGTQFNYTASMVSSLIGLGEIRLATGRARESFSFFDRARTLVEQLGKPDGRLQVYKGLATAHAQTGDFAKAYAFQSKWVVLKDSIFNGESAKKIARVQADYESEKKQAEIELLKKEQEVSRLWRNALGLGSLAALIIAGLIMSRQRLKIRNDQVLLAQSKVVAEKNEQLETQTHLLESQAIRLTAQAGQLQELDAAKSRFFTNVTHEFRTPLTLIIGTLSEKLHLLTETSETVIRQTEVSIMYRNAQRLLHLINQLLDLSKLESGRLDVRLQTNDIRPLVSVVVSLFSSLAEQRHMHLSVQLSPERLPVSYDTDLLEKVITNLLSNAFKFTPDGGEITVYAQPVALDEATFVQIVVEDSGIGITPDQTERIFERFYQGTPSRADRQPGTGVGLSLVREIVDLHQGRIQVENKAGSGARFVVLLPFVALAEETTNPFVPERLPAEQLVATVSPGPDSESPMNKANDERPLLLIVEDNEDVRTFIRNLMQTQYRVMTGENGRAGLTMAQTHLPDLIISDWMMPDMDGIALCHQIKSNECTSHIPFILLTALSAQDKRLTGLETGADDYLTKPFDSRELLIRAQNLIRNRRKLHERFSREIRIQPNQITVTSADEKFMTRVMTIVEANLNNSEFSVEQFGREVGLSRMQLHRKLLALTGQASGDFIRVMRLKRAAQLLDGRSGNVSEIAYAVGFNSLSYFAKCFRDQFGVLPTEYQGRLSSPA
ncbi:tetratricopeptide repeat protein [Spirosoma radiotolerans]|uniref:tetratricopeptide repeat protein n=1 Tax=Spirosoma radiotolerans TaxID=1379870 RepID=UPI000696CEE7|nr:tetratricopeptide repeat protein [Spirosoma radiotolerans]